MIGQRCGLRPKTFKESDRRALPFPSNQNFLFPVFLSDFYKPDLPFLESIRIATSPPYLGRYPFLLFPHPDGSEQVFFRANESPAAIFFFQVRRFFPGRSLSTSGPSLKSEGRPLPQRRPQ